MVENAVVSGLLAHGLTEGVAESAPVGRAFEIIFIGRLERWKAGVVHRGSGPCLQAGGLQAQSRW
jgi:hypothetical protein